MEYEYYICDVFTDTRFGGNPLAVLPDARGLDDARMQQIAREFNFSESTFVLPPERGGARRVRIFTPTVEVPFAGHPNIGTAFVLASIGALGADAPTRSVIFEERAGRVAIEIRRAADGRIVCELEAPGRLSLGKSVSSEQLAAAVCLEPGDVVSTRHAPMVASVGLPFVFAELVDRDALARARPSLEGAEALARAGVTPDVHVYVRSDDDFDLRARMFAILDGVPEDPATGSANCALAGLLSALDPARDGDFEWQIAQGVEMGRPSVLEARTEKRSGEVVAARIGGASVMVSRGSIEVG